MSIKGVPDIGEMYEFWELKEEIESLLCRYYNTEELDVVEDRKARNLIIKIESLGKKESE